MTRYCNFNITFNWGNTFIYYSFIDHCINLKDDLAPTKNEKESRFSKLYVKNVFLLIITLCDIAILRTCLTFLQH